jgi:acyl-CoA reductase-like NAD-dependent aldehyde dehydrogenase
MPVSGDHFVEHPLPRLISFTGSTDLGRTAMGGVEGSSSHCHVALTEPTQN